jgi:hypothetical protein
MVCVINTVMRNVNRFSRSDTTSLNSNGADASSPRQSQLTVVIRHYRERHGAREEIGDGLYSMAEVAAFVGRSLQLLRRYYGLGLLPEPKYIRSFRTKRYRRWTYEEAVELRDFFGSVRKGTLTPLKKHAARRRSKVDTGADIERK